MRVIASIIIVIIQENGKEIRSHKGESEKNFGKMKNLQKILNPQAPVRVIIIGATEWPSHLNVPVKVSIIPQRKQVFKNIKTSRDLPFFLQKAVSSPKGRKMECV